MKRSLAHRVLRNIPAAAVVIVLAYFVAGAAILHFRLDHLLWPPTPRTAEMWPPATLSSRGTGGGGAIARRVGPETTHCVVFFPGRHGGFTRYARDLFPSLNAAGLTVWAISYAGQDGAGGVSTRATVFTDVYRILQLIDAECPRSRTVFLGRSLGATVATVAASRWHPNGLVLEGAGLSLEAAVRRELARHWYLRPLGILPVESLMGRHSPIVWLA